MTHSAEPVPPGQLFRVLLIRFMETHRVLAPYVRHTTSKELKWCHQENIYTLSEIESWLADQLEDLDLTPLLSAAQLAELQAGAVSCLSPPAEPLSPGVSSPPSAQTVLPDRRPGSRRAPSSRRISSSRPPLERNAQGHVIFTQTS